MSALHTDWSFNGNDYHSQPLTMVIRTFQPADTDPLLALFQQNVPVAFGEHEVADYAHFLRTNPDPYFVADYEKRVAGAGGYYVRPDEQTARITWLLTNPATRGLGLGRALLDHCLATIRQQPAVRVIETQTSPVAYQFFEKFGFQLQYTEADHWAPGLDLYVMTLPA